MRKKNKQSTLCVNHKFLLSSIYLVGYSDWDETHTLTRTLKTQSICKDVILDKD